MWSFVVTAVGLDKRSPFRRLRPSKNGVLGGPWRGLSNRTLGDFEEELRKVWMKPAVREQEVGLEVTSYLPAEIDII